MTHDPLEQLLRDAEDMGAADSTRPDLAQRVREMAIRRAHRARLALSGVITGCVAALVMWFAQPGTDHRPTQPMVQIAKPTPAKDNARAELLALAQEADQRAAAAEAMWSAEQRARRTSVAASPDVADYVERAAFIMVYQAARMPAAGGAQSPAAAVYRQVSQAFPDAPSAQVARQRLGELTNRKGG